MKIVGCDLHTPGAPLIAHFAMGGISPRPDGPGSNPFHHKRPAHPSQISSSPSVTMFPDLSQPRCANPNQGHPGRAKENLQYLAVNKS